MRTLTPRDLVVELVRTLDEASVDWDWRSGGGGVIRMPTLWRDGSYQELERCLSEMRERSRVQWWHLSMRYRWGWETLRPVRTRKTKHGREPELPPRSELLITGASVPGSTLVLVKLYVWSEEVKPTHVEEGVDWLVKEMYGGDTSRLTLPQPLLYRALGLERGGSTWTTSNGREHHAADHYVAEKQASTTSP